MSESCDGSEASRRTACLGVDRHGGSQALLAWRIERAYRSLSEVPRWAPSMQLPSLSVIIPTRNEARRLSTLLTNLRSVDYPSDLIEVIVVDDDSSGGTAEIASVYGARVLRITQLPEGWRGKPHACYVGAQAARGEWLFFIDADMVHEPDGPRRAVGYAVAHDLDVLSLFLYQLCRGLAEHMLVPLGYATLFASWSIGTPSYFLNGQYILIRAAAYRRCGGFEAIRGEILEDVALGQRLQNCGVQQATIRGETIASVHMYDGIDHIWRSWMRMGPESLSWAGLPRAIVSALYTVLSVAPVVATCSGLLRRKLSVTLAGLAGWASTSGGLAFSSW